APPENPSRTRRAGGGGRFERVRTRGGAGLLPSIRPGVGSVVGANRRRVGHVRRAEAETDDAHGEIAEDRRAEKPAGQHDEASLADRREQAPLHQILERLDEARGNLPLELDPGERRRPDAAPRQELALEQAPGEDVGGYD